MNSQHSTNERTAEEMCALFEIGERELERIRELREPMMKNMERMVKEWYAWLEQHPEYDEFFSDKKVLEKVKKIHHSYWDAFFSGVIDKEYLELRKRLGITHARIGLPLDIYFAGSDHWVSLFIGVIDSLDLNLEDYKEARRAINKVTHMDMTISVQSYGHLINETIAAQSKTLLEMSTPVTKIWNGILLLPVVGIIDSKRAQDIMNATLSKIAETQARSFILDISGVAVVDTAVANHLIKITKATRLMGCESTISGVSPAIAQTIVDLGIDVGKIKTTSNMRDALAESFQKLGLEIKAMK